MDYQITIPENAHKINLFIRRMINLPEIAAIISSLYFERKYTRLWSDYWKMVTFIPFCEKKILFDRKVVKSYFLNNIDVLPNQREYIHMNHYRYNTNSSLITMLDNSLNGILYIEKLIWLYNHDKFLNYSRIFNNYLNGYGSVVIIIPKIETILHSEMCDFEPKWILDTDDF